MQRRHRRRSSSSATATTAAAAFVGCCVLTPRSVKKLWSRACSCFHAGIFFFFPMSTATGAEVTTAAATAGTNAAPPTTSSSSSTAAKPPRRGNAVRVLLVSFTVLLVLMTTAGFLVNQRMEEDSYTGSEGVKMSVWLPTKWQQEVKLIHAEKRYAAASSDGDDSRAGASLHRGILSQLKRDFESNSVLDNESDTAENTKVGSDESPEDVEQSSSSSSHVHLPIKDIIFQITKKQRFALPTHQAESKPNLTASIAERVKNRGVLVLMGSKRELERNFPVFSHVAPSLGVTLETFDVDDAVKQGCSGKNAKRRKQKSGTYDQAIHASGRHVNESSKSSHSSTREERQDDWTAILPLRQKSVNFTCLTRFLQKGRSESRSLIAKVNGFHGLEELLCDRRSLCDVSNRARRATASSSLRASALTPLCFVVPRDTNSLLAVADSWTDVEARWVYKPSDVSAAADGGAGTMQVFTTAQLYRMSERRSRRRDDELLMARNRAFGSIFAETGGSPFDERDGIVQRFVENQLEVDGRPVTLQVFALVTSVVPLRLLQYSEGIVFFRHPKNSGSAPGARFRKVPKRVEILSTFWQRVANVSGQLVSEEAEFRIRAQLVHLFTVATARSLGEPVQENADFRRSVGNDSRRFQLFQVDLMLNSSYHPFILDVQAAADFRTFPSAPEARNFNIVKTQLVKDYLKIIFDADERLYESAVDSVAEALQHFAPSLGISGRGVGCSISTKWCLVDSDVEYLLNLRREELASPNFVHAYPTAVPYWFEDGGIGEMDVRNDDDGQQPNPAGTSTLLRDGFLTQFQRYFEYGPRSTRPLFDDDELASADLINVVPSMTGNNRTYSNDFVRKVDSDDYASASLGCSRDVGTLTRLSHLKFEPAGGNMTPAFQPGVSEYRLSVPYDLVEIKVSVGARYCQAEARFEDRFGLTGSANYTIGLGETKISILVVDIRHTEPWVVATYKVTFERQMRGLTKSGSPQFNIGELETCGLVQDCKAKFASQKACGLFRDSKLSWQETLVSTAKLKRCASGHEEGRWLVPCTDCRSGSCFWGQARWQPYQCRYETVPKTELKHCLSGKKIIFLGDSTIRGMMYHLIERINGSLSTDDKTHDFRFYRDVNGGKTSVGFSYYPRFWLPTNQRPVFDEALYHVLLKARPLHNDSRTVLAIGGLQWLATQHFHMLRKVLRREGLEGIKVVVKTLGSGLRFPKQDPLSVSDEQEKLLQHSRNLVRLADQFGVESIDTFNMTISRFKDFLQGKCACHFYEVKEKDHTAVRWFENGRRGHHVGRRSFTVAGPVNEAYTEIFISQLCPPASDGESRSSTNRGEVT